MSSTVEDLREALTKAEITIEKQNEVIRELQNKNYESIREELEEPKNRLIDVTTELVEMSGTFREMFEKAETRQKQLKDLSLETVEKVGHSSVEAVEEVAEVTKELKEPIVAILTEQLAGRVMTTIWIAAAIPLGVALHKMLPKVTTVPELLGLAVAILMGGVVIQKGVQWMVKRGKDIDWDKEI